MDKNLLVIYNICGIKHDNIEMWINHLQDIVDQKYNNFTVAISGCKISESSKKTLIEFKNKYKNIVFNFTDEIRSIILYKYAHQKLVCLMVTFM